MGSRTIREFSVPRDIWPIVERWAQTEGFRLVNDEGSKRAFQKGHGLLVLPTKLEITQSDGKIHLEAWIHAAFINRLFSMFLLPEELPIESGGMRAMIPRSISRDAVNRLMTQLAQPLIN